MYRLGVPLILVFFILNARPAILGQLYGDVFWGISFVAFLFFGFQYKRIRVPICSQRILLFYFLFFLYLLIQGFWLGLNNFFDVVKSFLLFSIGMYAILFLEGDKIVKVIRIVSIVYAVFAVSYLITFFLAFIGIRYQLFEISLPMSKTFSYTFPVLFPFSPVYTGQVRLLTEYFPRAIANFREPGLLQMVLIGLFWLNYFLKTKKYIVINTLLVLLLIFTFSSAGYIAFFLSVVYFYFFSGRLKLKRVFLLIPFLFLFVFILFYSDTQFSLSDKVDSQSGLIRMRAAIISIELLKENLLWGIGFQRGFHGLDIGVNFLGTAAQLGGLGTVLSLLPIVFSTVFVFKNNRLFVTVLIPVFLTMFFSQPLYDKSILVFFLLLTVFLSTEKYES